MPTSSRSACRQWTRRRAGLRQGRAEDWSTGKEEGLADRSCRSSMAAGGEAGERRLGRHRRRLLDRADHHAELSRPTSPNLPGHNWSNAMSMATPIAHKGVVAGAKVMAMTALDLLTTAGAAGAGQGLFRQRAAEEPEVRADDLGRGQAADPDQRRHHGRPTGPR